jgi:ElaB/YqjD/DUF883 family membrane-anchored ribosome-binding protein
MENQNTENPVDHQGETNELLEQSAKLRKKAQETNEKLIEIKKKADRLLHSTDIKDQQ